MKPPIQNSTTPPLHHSSLSPVQLAWFIQRLHKRRRRAAAVPQPAAPRILGTSFDMDYTEPGWFDILLDFAFDHGTFPIATLEIWSAQGEATQYTLLDTLLSTAVTYRHAKATQLETALFYKLRYVSGTLVGPFCAPVRVDPVL